jgi:hypothetical protein
MTAIAIARGAFPFLTHRTMAQVTETEKLLAGKYRGGHRERRLDKLLDLRDANNPPPIEPDDAA